MPPPYNCPHQCFQMPQRPCRHEIALGSRWLMRRHGCSTVLGGVLSPSGKLLSGKGAEIGYCSLSLTRLGEL